MSSIPVSYSNSVGVLSCVSIIAQSWAIDKVCLISGLQNAPCNCYFLSKLYFLKVLTYTLSQELLFQRMQFFITANFQQPTSWSFHILKYLERGFTEWCTTQKIFLLNTMTKFFTSKLLPQGSNEQNKLSTNAKKFWGHLIKISISLLSFSTESAEKPTI